MTATNDKAILEQFDHLLRDDAESAAIVIREALRPVQGPQGVFFPPTFAGTGQGNKSGYLIDDIGPRASDPEGAARDSQIANRCTVDSVPSQANRLESRLLRYSGTRIPKVTITGSRVNETPLDLLDVGHRVGDAVLRYTADDGFRPFKEALHALVNGDAAPLTLIAPTSLVFGHWDSRKGESKSKSRRLVRSEIVAFNVAPIKKKSQYWSSIEPEAQEEIGELLAEAKTEASQNPDNPKNPASQLGMTDVPAPRSPGGVIAFGSIERTSMIALSGLRALVAFAKPTEQEPAESAEESDDASGQTPVIDTNRTLAMRRYLFALSLAAVSGKGVWDLREGCILVRNSQPPNGNLPKEENPITSQLVSYTGDQDEFVLPADVDAYVQAATAAFFGDNFPGPKELVFDPKIAKAKIDEITGGASSKPKTVAELKTALIALPEFAERAVEIKKMKRPLLESLWQKRSTEADEKQSESLADGNEDSGSNS